MIEANPVRAVVFDLDGTLLDSLPLVLRAFTHALAPFGGRPTREMFATLGGPPEKIFPALIADAADVPAALRRLAEFHREHSHQILPFAGAMAVLVELRSRGLRLAIWTGRDRATADELLSIHGMATFMDAVVCGDDLHSHKPDPAGLNEILRRLGVAASEAIYVGDADVDVLGGTGARVDTILIRHARVPEPGVAALARCLAATPGDAYDWLLRRTAC